MKDVERPDGHGQQPTVEELDETAETDSPTSPPVAPTPAGDEEIDAYPPIH